MLHSRSVTQDLFTFLPIFGLSSKLKAFFWLTSLISGFLRLHSSLGPIPSGPFTLCGNALTLTFKHSREFYCWFFTLWFTKHLSDLWSPSFKIFSHHVQAEYFADLNEVVKAVFVRCSKYICGAGVQFVSGCHFIVLPQRYYPFSLKTQLAVLCPVAAGSAVNIRQTYGPC